MARARKQSVQEGLSQSSPVRLEEQLSRQYRRMGKLAYSLLIQHGLVDAIAANDDVAIQNALSKVEASLVEEWPDSHTEELASTMAKKVDDNHRRKFYAALGAAVGATILGSDSPKTGVGGMLPPTPGFPGFTPPGSPLRRGRLAVKVSVRPGLFADEFTRENVKLIGELRAGTRLGLEDAIVRARQFGGDDPVETAERLRAIWKKNGVPSQLPTTRLKKNGQPYMLSTEKHANLVARDQINKLNGNLNQTRQDQAGITKFRWITQGDDRVRPSHEEINGNEYAWATGAPEIGGALPSQPVGCRCHAEAIVDRDQILANGNFIEL